MSHVTKCHTIKCDISSTNFLRRSQRSQSGGEVEREEGWLFETKGGKKEEEEI